MLILERNRKLSWNRILKIKAGNSSQTSRHLLPSLDPMTLTIASRVWWCDLAEVSRKMRKFCWTFGHLSLPTTNKITTEWQLSKPPLSLQLYRINQDKFKPQNIYKIEIKDGMLKFGKKMMILERNRELSRNQKKIEAANSFQISRERWYIAVLVWWWHQTLPFIGTRPVSGNHQSRIRFPADKRNISTWGLDILRLFSNHLLSRSLGGMVDVSN